MGGANVDGIVLLTSNSICSLLLYRKAFDFCILTLHLATLLWFVISFKISLLIISDYLHKISYHLWMRMLLFLFPISIPFIPFSCLIALARTSSMMLKRRCWKILSYLILSERFEFLATVMLTLCLLYTFFIKLNILSTQSLLRVFINNGCWILSKAYAIDTINVDINNLFTNF